MGIRDEVREILRENSSRRGKGATGRANWGHSDCGYLPTSPDEILYLTNPDGTRTDLAPSGQLRRAFGKCLLFVWIETPVRKNKKRHAGEKALAFIHYWGKHGVLAKRVPERDLVSPNGFPAWCYLIDGGQSALDDFLSSAKGLLAVEERQDKAQCSNGLYSHAKQYHAPRKPLGGKGKAKKDNYSTDNSGLPFLPPNR